MIRPFAIGLLLLCPLLIVDPCSSAELDAPDGWGGETIQLPPGFAPDMKWKGVERIRFAPGMMDSQSDTFFCYAFAFEISLESKLDQTTVKDEFLKYYRGLCTAVLRGQRPDVDPAKFTLDLKRIEAAIVDSNDELETAPEGLTEYVAQLQWVEPFATKKTQRLFIEIRTWTGKEHKHLFACVSPQPQSAKIWQQLREIRDSYLRQQAK